jgi:hypothetical protein
VTYRAVGIIRYNVSYSTTPFFVQELRDAGVVLPAVLQEFGAAVNPGAGGLTYCCANIYYNRVRGKGDSGGFVQHGDTATIDPVVSFAAVQQVLDAGVHAVLLCEVVFSGGPVSDAGGGKDSYSFEFFPKEAFDACGDSERHVSFGHNLIFHESISATNCQ